MSVVGPYELPGDFCMVQATRPVARRGVDDSAFVQCKIFYCVAPKSLLYEQS